MLHKTFCTVAWPGKCLLSFTSLVSSFLDQPLGSSPGPDWLLGPDLVCDWSGPGHVTGSVARQSAPAVLVRLVLAAGEITVFSKQENIFLIAKNIFNFLTSIFPKLSKVRARRIFKSTLWTIAGCREQLTNPPSTLSDLAYLDERKLLNQIDTWSNPIILKLDWTSEDIVKRIIFWKYFRFQSLLSIFLVIRCRCSISEE